MQKCNEKRLPSNEPKGEPQRIGSVKIFDREQSGTCSYSVNHKTLKIYIYIYRSNNNNICTQTRKVYVYINICICRQKKRQLCQ